MAVGRSNVYVPPLDTLAALGVHGIQATIGAQDLGQLRTMPGRNMLHHEQRGVDIGREISDQAPESVDASCGGTYDENIFLHQAVLGKLAAAPARIEKVFPGRFPRW